MVDYTGVTGIAVKNARYPQSWPACKDRLNDSLNSR
jgi:hypothetical protein